MVGYPRHLVCRPPGKRYTREVVSSGAVSDRKPRRLHTDTDHEAGAGASFNALMVYLARVK